MSRDLASLTRREYDLVIVGGGVVGIGTALCAAKLGLATALIEKEDFCAGTSSKSSELLHGGLRYLEQGRLGLVRQSSLYAGSAQRSAPHLCSLMPMLLPIYAGQRPGKLLLRAGMLFYDYYGTRYKHVPKSEFMSAKKALKAVPALREKGLIGALRFYEWGVDASRLCALSALHARRQGIEMYTHLQVTSPLLRNGRVIGVRATDAFSGDSVDVEARLVINAAGPWVDQLRAKAGPYAAQLVRPTKGVHILVPKIADDALIATAIDGRKVFIMPKGDYSLIGTTDDDYFGSLDAVRTIPEEVAYLLDAIDAALPSASVRTLPLLDCKAGVRPTVYSRGGNEDVVSREHRVCDHANDGLPGMLSVYGGKLSTYLATGQDAIKAACVLLGRNAAGVERVVNERLVEIDDFPAYLERETPALLEDYNIPKEHAEVILRRYASAWKDALKPLKGEPHLSEPLCSCGDPPVLAAEAHYAAKHEMAFTLDDFARRTGFGRGACDNLSCIVRAAEHLGDALGWSREDMAVHAQEFYDAKRERKTLAGGVR